MFVFDCPLTSILLVILCRRQHFRREKKKQIEVVQTRFFLVSVFFSIVSHIQRVMIWMWKENADPFALEPEQWCQYSDIEMAIIEDAYQANLPEALLDDYHIDLVRFLQISNSDIRHQRPVQRRLNTREKIKARKERFFSDCISPSIACTTNPGPWLAGIFCHTAMELFNISYYDQLKEDPDTRRMVIERAAEGLIIEGKKMGKQKEAEWMAQQLLNVKDGTREVVWACCVRIFCKESFLYKKMNEVMRLVEETNDQYEKLWRDKVKTFGPFALLLFDLGDWKSSHPMIVYRSANLSDDLIEQYHKTSTDANPYNRRICFPTFTSTSRNRAVAEFMDGNVLFEIQTGDGPTAAYNSDVSLHSDFDEEEELIPPGALFIVQSCIFDTDKHKWQIQLRAIGI